MFFESRVADQLFDDFDRIAMPQLDFLAKGIAIFINFITFDLQRCAFPLGTIGKGVNSLQQRPGIVKCGVYALTNL